MPCYLDKAFAGKGPLNSLLKLNRTYFHHPHKSQRARTANTFCSILPMQIC